VKPDLCLITGIYPPDIGGPAKFAETFLEWNADLGRKTYILSYTDGSAHESNNNGNIINLFSRKENVLFRYLRVIIKVRKFARKGIPILGNGCFIEIYLAHILSKRKYTLKIPGDIVWEHATNNHFTQLSISDFQSQKLNFKYKVFRFLFTRSLKRAHRVIVPSFQLKELCLNWGVDLEKVVQINNSVSLKRFPTGKTLTKDIDVLSVTRLVAWKNVDKLIEVCAKLKLRLFVVGDGPESDNLTKLAESLKANVVFCGAVSQRDLPKYYQRSKIFVLNSTFEATSYSLLEARASGCLSIANIGTGSEEVITHLVDGILVDPIDSESLLRAILFCLENIHVAQKMTDRARLKTSTDFNLEKNYRHIREISRPNG
jgi:glycosyltransferase involved in cell wall biosynthesis